MSCSWHQSADPFIPWTFHCVDSVAGNVGWVSGDSRHNEWRAVFFMPSRAIQHSAWVFETKELAQQHVERNWEVVRAEAALLKSVS